MKKIKPVVFKNGAWSKHVPFAYELVRDVKPSILVELGSHRGESYFSFCQSVKDHNLSTVCYAVDTWQGDKHAGLYGDEVYNDVNMINNSNFSNFSYLVRSTFEEAAKNFSNSSIDILHIDGFHTYDAVKSDFDGWFEKVSPGGIILFHDICVRHEDFGVWKFWEEVSQAYETFEFSHGYGLGVLFKNTSFLKEKTPLIDGMLSKDPAESIRLHNYFQEYYQGLDFEFSAKSLESENEALKQKCAKLSDRVTELEGLGEERQRKIEKIKSHFLYPIARLFFK